MEIAMENNMHTIYQHDAATIIMSTPPRTSFEPEYEDFSNFDYLYYYHSIESGDQIEREGETITKTQLSADISWPDNTQHQTAVHYPIRFIHFEDVTNPPMLERNIDDSTRKPIPSTQGVKWTYIDPNPRYSGEDNDD